MFQGRPVPFDTACTVWLGRLAAGTAWKELYSVMKKTGGCKWVELGTKGEGFACYSSEASARRAISWLNGSLVHGKPIIVDTFNSKQDLGQNMKPNWRKRHGSSLQSPWAKRMKSALSNLRVWSSELCDDEDCEDCGTYGRTQTMRNSPYLRTPRAICSSIIPYLPCGQTVHHLCADGAIDWDALPAEVDPLRAPDLYASFAQKKRWQVESLHAVLKVFLNCENIRVVDFGSGSGNSSLALAALFPLCNFTLVDSDSDSVRLARKRVTAAGLNNVQVLVGKIQNFSQPFDIAIAMSACGNATDFAQMQAIREGAIYLLVPCCVGKLKLRDTAERHVAEGVENELIHPRSDWMCSLCTPDEFQKLAACADDLAKGNCKCVVEHDRNAAAREAGYHTLLGKLHHEREIEVNTDLLIGAPHLWRGEVSGESLIGQLWEQADANATLGVIV